MSEEVVKEILDIYGGDIPSNYKYTDEELNNDQKEYHIESEEIINIIKNYCEILNNGKSSENSLWNIITSTPNDYIEFINQ